MTRPILALALAALLTTWPASAATLATARPRARVTTRASARAHAAAPVASTHAGSASRTLDDIHIEGEIPVPQVLFITARDQRRFVEFQPKRYLRSGRQLAEATLPPGWIVVTRSPITLIEETSR